VSSGTGLDALAIAERVRAHALALGDDHPDGDLTVVALLPSGDAFSRLLSRSLRVPHQLDAVGVARPGAGGRGHAGVAITRWPDRPLRGRAVVLVDAVVHTGLTLHYALRQLATLEPGSLEACVLDDRRRLRLVDDLPLREAPTCCVPALAGSSSGPAGPSPTAA
jgi:hypoxanthine-guanine phosphoribosyltransferase